jgi:HlyD family secretion protein
VLDPLLKSPGKLIAALIVAALGIAGVGIFLALRPANTTQNAAPSTPASPVSSSIPGGISALGRLEPGGEVICLAAPSSNGGFNSVIRKWMVKEGDRVQQNQVIAVLDTYDRLYAAGIQAQAQVREAESRVAQARTGAKPADVEAQKAEIARWEAERANAMAEYKRYENLYNSGAISKSDLDRRLLTLQTTTQQIDRAVNTAKGLVEVRPVDVQQAEAQLQVAMANLQRAKVDLETAAVRSPITGQVIKVHVKEGEQIGTLASSGGKTCNGIAELGRTDQMYAVAEVDESSIANVRRGQRATVSSLSKAFPGDLSGTVEYVALQIRKNDVLSTDPVTDTDTRVVEVKIRLDDSKPVAGLTNSKVTVKIAT